MLPRHDIYSERTRALILNDSAHGKHAALQPVLNARIPYSRPSDMDQRLSAVLKMSKKVRELPNRRCQSPWGGAWLTEFLGTHMDTALSIWEVAMRTNPENAWRPERKIHQHISIC